MTTIMSRLLRIDVLALVAILVIAAAIAVFPKANEDSGYPTIAEDLEPLRSAFNTDRDNVRAILLASPT